jgi:hypothetical protein
MAKKNTLYVALQMMYDAGLFRVNNFNAILQTRMKWLQDDKRNFLLYPDDVLLEAARVVTTAINKKQFPRFAFYKECNRQMMIAADKLINESKGKPWERAAKYLELEKVQKICDDVGLVLTVNRIQERLDEMADIPDRFYDWSER